jgi:hypothetical protein
MKFKSLLAVLLLTLMLTVNLSPPARAQAVDAVPDSLTAKATAQGVAFLLCTIWWRTLYISCLLAWRKTLGQRMRQAHH